jgi:hypothetical protein
MIAYHCDALSDLLRSDFIRLVGDSDHFVIEVQQRILDAFGEGEIVFYRMLTHFTYR